VKGGESSQSWPPKIYLLLGEVRLPCLNETSTENHYLR
jgi:hypothetical protein